MLLPRSCFSVTIPVYFPWQDKGKGYTPSLGSENMIAANETRYAASKGKRSATEARAWLPKGTTAAGALGRSFWQSGLTVKTRNYTCVQQHSTSFVANPLTPPSQLPHRCVPCHQRSRISSHMDKSRHILTLLILKRCLHRTTAMCIAIDFLDSGAHNHNHIDPPQNTALKQNMPP